MNIDRPSGEALLDLVQLECGEAIGVVIATRLRAVEGTAQGGRDEVMVHVPEEAITG
ncbi:hypothetical protein [Mesorhizobium sp. AR07]|uniref:hypothetical protein n=1 Tax=Mesorhizobium sp. AR07 TaxID=2865838 RepID=UPI002160A325|nr:hypothetical protein [Mesorhizobium sp. AR07]